MWPIFDVSVLVWWRVWKRRKKSALIYLWFQTLCQCTSSYNCRFPYGFDSTCCLLTNDGSAPLQIPKVIVTEKVGSSIGISHCRFSQNPNFPATSIVSNFKSWNIKDREQDDNICFQTCKQLRRPIFQNMSFFVGFAKWQKSQFDVFSTMFENLKKCLISWWIDWFDYIFVDLQKWTGQSCKGRFFLGFSRIVHFVKCSIKNASFVMRLLQDYLVISWYEMD